MKTNIANQDIRNLAKLRGLFLWQVAKRCGVSESTLMKWIREPLPSEDPRRQLILSVLEGTGRNGTEEKQEAARVSEV